MEINANHALPTQDGTELNVFAELTISSSMECAELVISTLSTQLLNKIVFAILDFTEIEICARNATQPVENVQALTPINA